MLLDKLMDKSTTADIIRTWHSTSVLIQYMRDYVLGDCLRLTLPGEKEFCYFSYILYISHLPEKIIF